MQKTIILDANAILRYILYDVKEQADEVESILIAKKVLILPEVMAEVIYVMTKYYDQPQNLVSDRILFFLNEINYENKTLLDAIEAFSENKFDFVDCLLFEYSKLPCYEIFTFDKRLMKKIAENRGGTKK